MGRTKMARVYVGDVGEIVVKEPKKTLPKDLDLSKYDFRELCNIAILVGIDLRQIIGVEKCSNHIRMVVLGDKEMPEGMNIFEHCVYCQNCWQIFRMKRL